MPEVKRSDFRLITGYVLCPCLLCPSCIKFWNANLFLLLLTISGHIGIFQLDSPEGRTLFIRVCELLSALEFFDYVYHPS